MQRHATLEQNITQLHTSMQQDAQKCQDEHGRLVRLLSLYCFLLMQPLDYCMLAADKLTYVDSRSKSFIKPRLLWQSIATFVKT